jgi:MFS family permease
MNSYVLLIALVVALGGFVFGVDSGQYPASGHASMAYYPLGIIATTLGHKTFAVYMYGPSAKNASLTGMPPQSQGTRRIDADPLTGAIVSVYNAGQALGTFITGYSADKFRRKWTICAAGMIGE